MAHIGHILSNAIPNPLPTRTYLLVRNVLQVLTEFLENIELSRLSSPSISAKLRTQISRIDQCMQQSSEQNVPGALNAVPKPDFVGSFDITQQSEIQNPVFPPVVSSSSLPADLFEDWPILSQADGFDQVNAFASSLGNGTRNSQRTSSTHFKV